MKKNQEYKMKRFTILLSAIIFFSCNGKEPKQNSLADELGIDSVSVTINPYSNVVTLGDSYKANIYLTAFNRKEKPILEFENNNRIKILNENGNIYIETDSIKWEGISRIKGNLKIKSKNGDYKSIPFYREYLISKRVISIANKILCRGIENPIEIGITDIPAVLYHAKISDGEISGHNGQYIVKPGKKDKCTITIEMNKDNKEIAEYEFKVVDIKTNN